MADDAAKDEPGTAVARQDGYPNLLRGGNFGNKGGGRPPSAVKALASENLYDLVPILVGIAKNTRASKPDRIRAIATVATIAMQRDEGVSPVELTARLVRQLELIASRPTWDSNDLIAQIDAIWQ